jgi:dolichyl-phosphate-mannose-protein mannosyltransferase
MVKVPYGKRELAIVLFLLFLAFMLRFAFFSNQGFQTDTNDFWAWFQRAADIGVRGFYSNGYWSDYPPLNIYIFWVFGTLAKSLGVFGTNLFTYVMKLPPNLFDMATAFIIFAFVRKRLNFKWALAASALYAFNPATIYDSAVWGQFDAIYTFFLVLSVYLVFESKPKLAAVAFMLGVLTKPQSIALAPLMVYLVWRKSGWKGLAVSILVAAATVFAVILPFEWSNPVSFLSNIYITAYGTYHYTSINAFNLWGFGGMWQPDTGGLGPLTFYVIGWLMFGALAAFTLYFVHKRFKVSNELIVLFGAFVLFFGFFMLPTRIHERYMFPAISMLALMFPFFKKMRPMYVVLTVTCFVNEAYVLDMLVRYGAPNLTGDPVAVIVSLINIMALVYVLVLMLGELWGRNWLKPNPTAKPQAEKPEEEKADAAVE